MAFQFYNAPDEDLERLRGNEAQCIAYLSACKPLATKLATVAGIYTPLTEEDERVLQGFHLVQQAHTGYEYEGRLERLCDSAGLLPSDAGLLAGRVESLFREKEPVIYQAEAIAIFEQWLHDPDEEGKDDG
jgi:hypothetical protein